MKNTNLKTEKSEDKLINNAESKDNVVSLNKQKKDEKKVENKKAETLTKTKHKKQVRVSKQEYIDPITQEMRVFDVIETNENADFYWEKCWMMNLMVAMDAIGNDKVRVMTWLLTNKNSENQIIATQEKIAKEVKVCKRTVLETIKALTEAKAIKKVVNGVYMINPDIAAYGSSKKRDGLILRFTKS